MQDGAMVSGARALSPAGLAHLLVVYAGWSSTYLAIRVAVREGAGFPPFVLAGSRLLLAGAILLTLAVLWRDRVRLERHAVAPLVGSALLLWVGGNGLVVWAEQRAASSFAALLVGSTPIWVALMEAGLDRRSPSFLLAISILLGFVGLGVLTVPAIGEGIGGDPVDAAALLLATACWAAGSIWQSRRPSDLSPFASSGYQHVVGGIGFLVLVGAFREPLPEPSPDAWWAWAYLVVFGSIVTFTSFTQALRLLPTSVVFTYSYVNPVGALLLGRLLLGEPITLWTVAGAALVLTAVAGVFHDRQRHAIVGRGRESGR